MTLPPLLLDGYANFRAGRYASEAQRYLKLGEGAQKPKVMIIACCDSRAAPETIFDAGPGEIFVVRNVANLVPPFETGGGLHGASAAIEFGVLGLEVKHIVVLGHGQCGGIKAALSGVNLGQKGNLFVDDWMGIVRDARDAVAACNHDNPQRVLEWEAIKVSLANLRTFPFIAEREARGDIKLHGAWFAIAEGSLYVLNEEDGAFGPV